MTGLPDDLSGGEIARVLTRLEQAIGELRAEIGSLPYVRSDVWASEHNALLQAIRAVRDEAQRDNTEIRRDLHATQDNLRWLVRTVAAAVIGAVITGIILAYRTTGGG